MPEPSSAHSASQKVALFANVGAELTHYDVDVSGAELIKRGTVTLPAGVQYAWPPGQAHPRRRGRRHPHHSRDVTLSDGCRRLQAIGSAIIFI